MTRPDIAPTHASATVKTHELESKHREAALDEALTESFPASDPVAISVTCADARGSSPQRSADATTPRSKRRKRPAKSS